MGDYERSTEVNAPAQAAFDYLADVRNLPRYFNAMTSAEPRGEDAVYVVANVHGTTREGEAWFRVDRDAQRLAWGSEGPNEYHGELAVSGDASTSSVHVFLHTERVDSQGIEEGLANTCDNIKRLVEEDAAPRSASQ